MQFRRKGRGRFHCDDFTIVRPSGRSLDRDRLELIRSGHDYNFRFDDDQVWLLDDEREVGYARGSDLCWQLTVAGRALTVEQVKYGLNHSTVKEDEAIVTEMRGSGFPLKLVETNGEAGLSEEQSVFVVAIAMLGWRESDRAMIGTTGRPEG